MGTLSDRIAADSAKFINSRDFAVRARYTHVGSAARIIFVLHHPKYSPSDPLGIEVSDTVPAVLAREDDVEDIAREDMIEIEIDGDFETFYVTDAQEEEDGYRMVMLSENPPHG